ncbi:YhgE/Pip family protein [Propionibacterium sp.]|uniref:YhgE/Pip family protein n=1 Tax=Propionibacterium sp. TaxID=1977903 RepID=UPI0039ED826F
MRYFLTSFELARFRHSHLTRLAVVIILVLPTIYALTYLAANWNPQGNLHKVPAAVVNEDVPASTTMNGQTTSIDAGQQLGAELTGDQKDNFNWTLTNRSAADQGLESGKYTAELVIPSNFSSTLATVSSTSPQPAQLTVRTNDATNFISGNVATEIATTIQQNLSRSLTTSYLNQVYLSFDGVHTQLGQAASGAGSLSDGTGQALSGAQDLTNGSASLAAGADQAQSGAKDLSGGVSSLANGARSAASGVDTYTTGVDQASAGAVKLNSGITSYTNGVDAIWAKAPQLQEATQSLNQGAQAVSSGASQLSQGLGAPDAAADGSSGQLVPGAGAVSQGLTSLDSAMNSEDSKAQVNQLVTGSQQLSQGVSTYTQGVDQVAAKCQAVHGASDPICQALAGITSQDSGKLASSSAQVSTGTEQVATSMSQAGQSVTQLDAGAKKVLSGAQQAATGAQKLADPSSGAGALAAGAAKLQASVGTTSDQASQQNGSPSLLGGLHDLASSSDSLKQGSGSLAQGLSQLSSNSAALRSGASQLATGSSQLANGASALDDGLGALSQGAHELTNGSGSLASGLTTVQNGMKELASKLTGGAQAVPASSAQQSQDRATATADQVTADAQRDNAVGGYGAGLAPYFLCIGLWVGGMVCYLLVRPVSLRGMVSTAPSWRSAVTGWFPGMLVGTLGALFMWGVLHFALGLDAAHPLAAILFTALVGVVFAGVHQALVAAFHTPGRLFGLILLVLQLGAAGAIYPVQTAGPFFQVIHHVLPMSYGVDGLRRLIAGGPTGQVWMDALILVGFGALTMLLTLRACHRQRVWTLSRLHASLDL